MGGKSSPKAPDYQGAAVATGEASKEVTRDQTYANRPDQYTPFGSIQWTNRQEIDPSTGQAVTRWDQTTTLDPASQAALDAQQQIGADRSQLAQDQIGATQDALGQQFNWNGLPEVASTPDVPDFYGQDLAQMGSLPNPNQHQEMLPEGALRYGDLQQSGSMTIPEGGVQFGKPHGASMQDLGETGFLGEYGTGPTAQNYNADQSYDPAFGQVQFDRNMSLIGPQQERAMAALDTQLRNQGLTPNTEAYDNAMNDLRNQQSEVRTRMSQDAVQAGANEQQRQFDRTLGAGAQTYSEALGAGQFAGQQRGQRAGEVAQRYNQEMGVANFNNALRAQQFGEYNQLQQQQSGNQQQQYQREMDTARYQDAQRQQQVNEQLAFGNQGFNQQMAQQAQQNTLRQQAIAEEAQRRGMSLNEMNALLSGQQVAMPNMPNFMGAERAQGADFLGAAQAQGNFDQQGYATALGPVNSLMENLGR